MKLDLGGTACYEDAERAVNICLDGSDSGDETTPVIIGDYDLAPFKDGCFEEALGSCYLEAKPNWSELHRVMAPGAKVIVKACEELYASDEEVIRDAQDAGFRLIEFIARDDEGYPDSPMILEK